MNLRDKLRAIDTPKKPAAVPPARTFTSCWSRQEIRDLDDFPEAFQLCRDTVDLMCGTLTPPRPLSLIPPGSSIWIRKLQGLQAERVP